MSGIPPIDCIYIINLQERKDKWTRVNALFNKKGLHPNRVNAMNGMNLSYKTYRELSGPYPFRVYASDYGWLLSFLSVLKDAYQREFECIWVCQDSVHFYGESKCIPLLLETLNEHDPNWDIFYTDCGPRIVSDGILAHKRSFAYDPRPGEKLKPFSYYLEQLRVNDDIVHIRQRVGMHSTILSRKGIKKILDYFTHVFVWSPLEINIHYIPGIREYSATRDIVSNQTSTPFDTSSLQKQDSGLKVISVEAETAERKLLFEKAQALQENNLLEEALSAYQKRSVMGGAEAEVFWSLYQKGIIEQQLNYDDNIFIESYTKAYHLAPDRTEPLYRLACYYHMQGKNNLGYLLANVATRFSKPTHTLLVEDWIYQWGVLLEYSLCSYYTGRYEEFIWANNLLLEDLKIPSNVRQCVEDNLKLYQILIP